MTIKVDSSQTQWLGNDKDNLFKSESELSGLRLVGLGGDDKFNVTKGGHGTIYGGTGKDAIKLGKSLDAYFAYTPTDLTNAKDYIVIQSFASNEYGRPEDRFLVQIKGEHKVENIRFADTHGPILAFLHDMIGRGVNFDTNRI